MHHVKQLVGSRNFFFLFKRDGFRILFAMENVQLGVIDCSSVSYSINIFTEARAIW